MKKATDRRAMVLIIAGLIFSLFTACAEMSGTAKSASSAPVLDRIQENKELVVGTAGSMPPFNMTTKEGKVIGFEPDLAEQIAKAMGVALKLEVMPFSELLNALETGKVDMVLSNMTMTPGRNLKVAFVGPYYVSGKGLLTKLETLAAAADTEEIDRRGPTLAALAGSTSESFVKNALPHASLVATKDYDEAVDFLFQDKVDGLIADHPICIVSVLRYPEKKLYALVTPLTYEPIGVALPAGDPLLVNWMDNFFMSFTASGKMKALGMRWFGNGDWLKELP